MRKEMRVLAFSILLVFPLIVFAEGTNSKSGIISGKDIKLKDLPLKTSIEQYGITWNFEKPVRVGQFVNGDYYIVGPATVSSITPEPKDGRNGSCLNLSSTADKIGFDDRVLFGRYDPKLYMAPPINLTPGDRLLSSVSLDQISSLKPWLWISHKDQRSPIRTIAALTCLDAPVPTDAFRPAYSGKDPKIYLKRNIKRDLLPKLPKAGITFKAHQGGPDQLFTINDFIRWFQRPWTDFVMDEFGAPFENMPVYGREFTRAVGMAGLLLCLDFTPQEKEPLLINFIQVGIDMWGLAGQGAQPPVWNALGGHANGRKWPIIFAGALLGDKEMQSPDKTYPYLRFSEDTQTMFDKCWTGAKVVWTGHVGKNGSSKYPDWGAYEHLQPKDWKGNLGESYRRCCTSNAWVAEALAARILHLEKAWNHDAFFAYTDRWMTEDETEFLKILKEQRGLTYSPDVRQGSTWDPFTKDMWTKYRDNIPPAPDGTVTPKAEETWK